MLKCYFNNLQSNFIEITLQHGCFPINLLHIFRTTFPKNTFGGLLLNIKAEIVGLKSFVIEKIYVFKKRSKEKEVSFVKLLQEEVTYLNKNKAKSEIIRMLSDK